MAYLFVPPVRAIGKNTLASPHPGNDLWRHFRPKDVGANVFITAEGVVTETDTADMTDTVFHGGHEHYVTAAQAALLTAAGYTVTVVADPLPDRPLWSYGADLYGGDGYYGGVPA